MDFVIGMLLLWAFSSLDSTHVYATLGHWEWETAPTTMTQHAPADGLKRNFKHVCAIVFFYLPVEHFNNVWPNEMLSNLLATGQRLRTQILLIGTHLIWCGFVFIQIDFCFVFFLSKCMWICVHFHRNISKQSAPFFQIARIICGCLCVGKSEWINSSINHIQITGHFVTVCAFFRATSCEKSPRSDWNKHNRIGMRNWNLLRGHISIQIGATNQPNLFFYSDYASGELWTGRNAIQLLMEVEREMNVARARGISTKLRHTACHSARLYRHGKRFRVRELN